MNIDKVWEWNDAVTAVTNWAARNGLSARLSIDETVSPEWDPEMLAVELRTYPDLNGVTFTPPCVAQLVRRYVLYPNGKDRVPGLGPYIEVRLSRHGTRYSYPAVIGVRELDRFTVEIHHLDRIG